MRIRSVLTHSAQAVLEGALIATLVVGLMAGTAFAGKPGGGGGGGHTSGGTGSLTLVMVTDANSIGVLDRGDTVTFKAWTAATTEPHVRLQCSQGGAPVLSLQAGMYPSYLWPWLQDMTLSWVSGAADCTAQIYYFAGSKTVWSTKLSFQVAG